jgi:hypothetical protein
MAPRRNGRHRQGLEPSPEVLHWLRADYPPKLKELIVLSARGLHGSRRCLHCPKTGQTTRLLIPAAALRPHNPDFSGVGAYWVCAYHREQPELD